MPRFVHIADEKNAKMILKNGLKIGKRSSGIFCMPATSDFYISHQWLRELKRGGAKTLVGVYFKIESQEKIWFGRYTENHKHQEAGKALQAFRQVEDKLGFEFLIERKIEAKEIVKIKMLPQNIGWRYSPDSHRQKLECGCPICITVGEINSKKKREKIEPPFRKKSFLEIVESLKIATDKDEVYNLFWHLGRVKRRSDPEVLRFIIEDKDIEKIKLLALSLTSFRHPNTMGMLLELCRFEEEEVKINSVESIFDLKGKHAFSLLEEFKMDKTLQNLLEERRGDEGIF